MKTYRIACYTWHTSADEAFAGLPGPGRYVRHQEHAELPTANKLSGHHGKEVDSETNAIETAARKAQIDQLIDRIIFRHTAGDIAPRPACQQFYNRS